MKKFIVSLLLGICLSVAARAGETVFTNAETLPLYGKVCQNTVEPYARLPKEMKGKIKNGLFNLGRYSAGLFLRFSSDAGEFTFRWDCISKKCGDNMSLIVKCGLALYALDNGKWIYAGTARPRVKDKMFEHTISLSKLAGKKTEYMLYLGLYDGIKDLSIGIPEGFVIGAPEVAELMASYPDPGVFVLDFCPNGGPELTREKAGAFFKILRKAHPDVPVIFVECPHYPGMRFDEKREKTVNSRNEALKEVFDQAKRDGEKNIHYVKGKNLLPDDNVGTIEGTHFTDIGFVQYSKALYPIIRKCLR